LYNTVVTIAGAVVVGGALLYVGYRLGEAGEEQQPSPPSERIQAEAPQPVPMPVPQPVPVPVPVPAGEPGRTVSPRPDEAERPPSRQADAQTPGGEDRLIAPEGPPAPQLAQREPARPSASAPSLGPVPAPRLAPRAGRGQTGDAPRTPYAWATASDVGYRLGPDGEPLKRKPRAGE
jgi:hypothetical protein